MELKATLEKKEIRATVGFKVKEIVRDRLQFEISFTEKLFEQDLKLVRLIVPKNTHSLGSNYAVRKICKTENGKDGNIVVQWEMLVNGDFVLYSHSPFAGKIILEEI